MITPKDIDILQVGHSISERVAKDTEGKKYIQRVRNYAQDLKKPDVDYTVRVKGNVLTVTRIDTTGPHKMTDKLRSMKVGEIIHPAPSRKHSNIKSIADSLDGEYKVSSVIQVERIK